MTTFVLLFANERSFLGYNLSMANTKEMKNGAIYDLDKGRIVKGANITTAQAIAMQARRWRVAEISKLRGMIAGAGIEVPPDDDLEALLDAAGKAEQAYTAHMGKTFLKSNSLRGMGEVKKYLTLLAEGRQEAHRVPDPDVVNAVTRLLQEVKSLSNPVIDADVIDG
jgi:hypothetical protein